MQTLNRPARWAMWLALAAVPATMALAAWWPAKPGAEPAAAVSAAGTGLATAQAPVGAPAGAAPPQAAAAQPPTAAPAPVRRSATGVFESDASGRLVVDERMRLAVEAMVALNPAEALPALVEAEVQGLPQATAAAARELVLRYDGYQKAQRAAFPPGVAPLVPEDAMAQLDALVALRGSWFGAEAARRMFGADEAVTRRLLQLMAEDRSTALSMEQKAMRAQLRYDQERGAAPPGR